MQEATSGDLSTFRAVIDRLDRRILESLAERFAVCRDVAEYKLEHKLPMMQPQRVRQVIDTRAALGEELGVSGAFVQALYEMIIGEACRLEDALMGAPEKSAE